MGIRIISGSGGSGSGASTALDNLASVAINTSLISDTDNTDDLGTDAKKWRTGYFATSVVTPSLLSDAGDARAIASTSPAAANGASQAGEALTITASNAVASLDTAGAAAGGSVTITAGNAARLTSGNANGGNVVLATGTGIGTRGWYR